jgi:hypothetical protein
MSRLFLPSNNEDGHAVTGFEDTGQVEKHKLKGSTNMVWSVAAQDELGLCPPINALAPAAVRPAKPDCAH